MPTTFRPYAPEQDLLLQPSLREWLPAGHLSYFISDVIEELDLGAFYKSYEGDGRRNAPFEPRMMLKVLIYAYPTGVFSSRKIARKLEEDVAFRVLAKAMSYQRIQAEELRLKQEIAELCEQARSTDAEEDRLYGANYRGDESPEELHHRQARLEKIRDARARLQHAQRDTDTARGRHKDDDRKPPGRGRRYKRDFGVPEDKAQSNFTDPESSIMKTAEGFQQCYNGQLVVDRDFQIIVENKLAANSSDNGELLDVLTGVEGHLGERPEVVLADAGYRDEKCFANS